MKQGWFVVALFCLSVYKAFEESVGGLIGMPDTHQVLDWIKTIAQDHRGAW